MMNMESILNEISDRLIKTGEALNQKLPENNAFLIYETIQFIEKNAKDIEDKDVIFMSYFLRVFFRDVWTNIAVESSYRVDDNISREVLKKIGIEFKFLGECIKNKNYSECYKAYTRLIFSFLQTIRKIRDKEVAIMEV